MQEFWRLNLMKNNNNNKPQVKTIKQKKKKNKKIKQINQKAVIRIYNKMKTKK